MRRDATIHYINPICSRKFSPVLSIFPIVEGHGEIQAVPILLRRFAHEVFEEYAFHVLPAYRLPKGRMAAAQRLENVVMFARRKLEQHDGRGAIVVIADADDDCPARSAPALLERARGIAQEIPVSVVFAKAEYEAWFLGAIRSLRGARRISNDAPSPPDAEAVRGAKEFLQRHCMIPGERYSPTVDQPFLTSRFDLEEARQACPSFDKLWRDLETLFRQGDVPCPAT